MNLLLIIILFNSGCALWLVVAWQHYLPHEDDFSAEIMRTIMALSSCWAAIKLGNPPPPLCVLKGLRSDSYCCWLLPSLYGMQRLCKLQSACICIFIIYKQARLSYCNFIQLFFSVSMFSLRDCFCLILKRICTSLNLEPFYKCWLASFIIALKLITVISFLTHERLSHTKSWKTIGLIYPLYM